MKLPIEIYSLRSKEISTNGFLTFSDYGFDSKSGLLLMRGEIANVEGNFLPGQSIKVKLPIDSAKNVMLVPENAVKINQLGPYVYRITAENTAELCQVTQGEEFGYFVSILDGIRQGDRIVTEGHLRLYPGISVDPVMVFEEHQGKP